jgi:hypothetical protein
MGVLLGDFSSILFGIAFGLTFVIAFKSGVVAS